MWRALAVEDDPGVEVRGPLGVRDVPEVNPTAREARATTLPSGARLLEARADAGRAGSCVA